MKIACSSWSLHREIPQSLSLLQFPAWCGSQGIPAIEILDTQIPSMEMDYLKEFKQACDHAGVSIACLAISNDFTIPDADQLFAQVERTRQLLYDVAAPLGCPVVRVFIGMADTSKDGDQRALEAFRGMVTDLKATGISMALENHAREQTDPGQTAAIIAGVGSPLFGSCLDCGSLPPERRFAMATALAPLAKYVHAKSFEFDDAGNETTIDYWELFANLTESGYDGVISIEYEGRGDAYEGVLKTRDMINRYWYRPTEEIQRRAA